MELIVWCLCWRKLKVFLKLMELAAASKLGLRASVIAVHVVHLHKHTHETLSVRACNAIWHWNTWSYANSVELSQRHVNGFPGNLGWHDRRRSARMHVELDVSICTMEIGWHDRRDQHKGVLDRMCLNAPIQNYELLRLNRVSWQTRTIGSRCQGCNAMVMGY